MWTSREEIESLRESIKGGFVRRVASTLEQSGFVEKILMQYPEYADEIQQMREWVVKGLAYEKEHGKWSMLDFSRSETRRAVEIVNDWCLKNDKPLIHRPKYANNLTNQ